MSEMTPEQRADRIENIRIAVDDGLEHEELTKFDIHFLLVEVDRITAELREEREDHNRAKDGRERAAGELHAADERAEKAEQTTRAYQQTLEERTRERDEARRREPMQSEGDAHEHSHDQSMGPSFPSGECFIAEGGWAGRRCSVCRRWVWGGPTACECCVARKERDETRAELAALRAAVQVGEGEVLMRARRSILRTTEPWIGLTIRKIYVPVLAEDIVQFPPATAPVESERDAALREIGQHAIDLGDTGDCPFCQLRDDGSHDPDWGGDLIPCPAGAFLKRFPPSAQEKEQAKPGEGGGSI